MKKLLEENSDLKQRLESAGKVDTEDVGDSGKENEPDVEVLEPAERRQPVPRVTLRSKVRQKESRVLRSSRPNTGRPASAQLPSQRNARSNEREKVWQAREPLQQSLGRAASQPCLADSLQQQVVHLSQQNSSLHHQLGQLRAELCRPPGPVHPGRLQCLQSQVCHLQHELLHRPGAAPPQSNVPDCREQLSQAEREIEKLVTKCDSLLEQKRSNLEKISKLQKQVDQMMSSPDMDSRVRGLITNIETQRDNYKHQVEKLIKDLQAKEKVIVVEKEKVGLDLPDGKGRRTLVSKPRRPEEVLPESLPARPGEELSVSLELLEVRLSLAERTAQLEEATAEAVRLRGELATLQSQLNLHNVKETQTSPSLERRKQNLEESVNEMKKLVVDLEKENSKLRKSNTELERQKSMAESMAERDIDVVDTGMTETRIVQDLQEKVRFLEAQLSKTEDNLRNCQNLMTEGSKRTLELNGQIVKLRQEEALAKKNVDDLRLKIDKKDELIRRIIEDKDKLLIELNESRDKMQELKSQVYQKTELLSNIDRSKDSLESELSDLQMTVKQLERNLREKDRKVEELKSTRQSLDEEARNARMDNGSLRAELEQQRSEVERLSDETRGKAGELLDIRAELQRYITEVKRVEELLDRKESDRINLLTQYEELSKEVSAYEATNRSLGKVQVGQFLVKTSSLQRCRQPT